MSTPTPGWYADPAGSGRLRWWNGTEWTEQFQTAPAAASNPSAQQQTVGGARTQQSSSTPATPAPTAGPARPAPNKGMLAACIAAWAVAVILCVAVTISLSAFNKAGRAVEESRQGVTDAQQAVNDANSLGLSPNGDSE